MGARPEREPVSVGELPARKSRPKVNEQLAEVEAEIKRLSTHEPWAPVMPYLMQLPGLGLITALTVLAAIGEVSRFESSKHLVGYAGLGASVHSSGETHHTGRITKTGLRDLRYGPVEAAWAAVEHHPPTGKVSLHG